MINGKTKSGIHHQTNSRQIDHQLDQPNPDQHSPTPKALNW